MGRILATAREHLGMDIAYLALMDEAGQVLARIAGDPSGFGVAEGTFIPREETICHHVLAGRAPSAVPDIGEDAVLSGLEVPRAAGARAYVGARVERSTGELYGTLCCVASAPQADLAERDARFLQVLARLLGDELERSDLERERRRLQRQAAGMEALLIALNARHRYTGDHSGEVVALAIAVAHRLGLSAEQVVDVEHVARLHDVGKVGIPDTILVKPGPLSDPERQLMRRHPEIGEQILGGIDELAHLAPAVRAEHERWDGRGYPDGLRGEAIPVPSRIVLACDAYHAMTSDRPYRRRMPPDRARSELRRHRGTQFWPDAVDALLAVLEGS